MADLQPFPLEGDYARAVWMRSRARELGGAAIAPLRDVAARGAVAMRALALQVLAELDPVGSEGFVLARLREEPDAEVTEAATRALGYCRGPASFALLGDEATHDRAARVALRQRLREEVGDVLRRCAEIGPARVTSVALELLAERADLDLAWLEARARAEPLSFTTAVLEAIGRSADPEAAARVLGHVIDARPPEAALAAALRALASCASRGAESEPDRHVAAWLASPPIENDVESAFAHVAVAREPARVYDELAPVVSAGAKSGEDPRGAAVLAALLAQLTSAFAPGDGELGVDEETRARGRVPDPRWLALLDALLPELPELSPTSPSGTEVELRAALAWASGARAPRGPRYVVCGAEEGIPLVVAGFEVGGLAESQGAVLERVVARGGPSVGELHFLQHQCAGYSCTQLVLLGVPLSSATLARELAPDSDAALQLFALTQGHYDFTRATLPAARAILARMIPGLPALEHGVEAAVSTAACKPEDLASATAGLDVVRVLSPTSPWLRFADYESAVLRAIGPFTPAQAALLADVGVRLRLGAPRLHVLWANSD